MTEPAPRVLIVFVSRGGAREHQALECAVGAVQARGVIRLRRIDDGQGNGLAGKTHVLDRMRKEYVAPTADDVRWAEAIVFCGLGAAETEWDPYLKVVETCSRSARNNTVAIVIPRTPPTLDSVSATGWSSRLADLGLVVVPEVPVDRESDPASDPRAIGQVAVEAVRFSRQGTEPMS